MTITSLLAAVTIGVVLGLCGRWLVPAGRRTPFWVPVAVGVGAAVLGTVTARLAGVDTSTVSAVELVVQGAFAATGVTAVAMTGERPPPDPRPNSVSRQR